MYPVPSLSTHGNYDNSVNDDRGVLYLQHVQTTRHLDSILFKDEKLSGYLQWTDEMKRTG